MRPELFEATDALFRKFLACETDCDAELAKVRELLKDSAPRERVEVVLKLLGSRLYGLDEQLKVLLLAVIGELRVIMVGCYDDKTEVLTENGWKYWKNITIKDKLATLIDGKLNYCNPISVSKQYYRGPMYRLTTKGIDLCVTPNHQLYVATKLHNGRSDFKLIEAEDIFGHIKFFKKDIVWEGHEVDYFVLPELRVPHKLRNGNFEELIYPETKIPMDVWLKFIGHWLTDGYCKTEKRNRNLIRIFLCQTKLRTKLSFRQSLKNITSYLSRPYMPYPPSIRENKDGFDIFHGQLGRYLLDLGKKNNRRFPKELLSLSKRQLQILFEALIDGDGTRNNNGEAQAFWTASPYIAEAFEEICLKIGLVAHRYKEDIKYPPPIIRGRQIKSQITTWGFSLNEHQLTPIVTKKNNERWERYEGFIYCAEILPSHTLYVRRNGKSVWCGNSPATGKNHAFYRISELLGLKWRVVTKNEVATKSAVFAEFNPRSLNDPEAPKYLPGPALLAESLLLDEWGVYPPQIKGEVHHLLEDGKFANISAKARFITLAKNPELQEIYGGSYEEPNLATMSRTEVMVPFSQPSAAASQIVIQKFARSGRNEPPLPAVTSWEEVALEARKEITEVQLDDLSKMGLGMLGQELTACKVLDDEGYAEDKMAVPRQVLNQLCERCELRSAKVSGIRMGHDTVSICSRYSAPIGRINRSTTVLAQALAWFDGRSETTIDDVLFAAKFTLLATTMENTGQYVTSKDIGQIIQAFKENQARRLMPRTGLDDRDAMDVLWDMLDKADEHINPDPTKLINEFKADYPFEKFLIDILDFKYQSIVLPYWKNMVEAASGAVELAKVEEDLQKANLEQTDMAALLDKIKKKMEETAAQYEFDGDPTRLLKSTVAVLRSYGDKKTTPTEINKALHDGKFESNIISVKVAWPNLSEKFGKVEVSAAKEVVEKFKAVYGE